MEIESLRLWLPAINMICTAAQFVWMYLEKRSDKTNERVDALSARVEKIDRDVAGLAVSAETAPSHNDLSGVYRSINGLSEKVDTLVGSFDTQSATLRQILSRVIERGMP